jgi:hypothetical protein
MLKALGRNILGNLLDFRKQVECRSSIYCLSFREDEFGQYLSIAVQGTLSAQMSRPMSIRSSE